MAQIILFSPSYVDRPGWDWESLTGGSEACHIQMSRELAKLGHEVISYAPIPPEKQNTMVDGAQWLNCDSIYPYEGIWVFFRTLTPLDQMEKTDKMKVCVFLHDVAINEEWSHERVDKIDKIFVLSKHHKDFLSFAYPHIADKLHVMRSGLDLSLVEEVEKEGVERIPTKLIYASSPDRGLMYLLDMFLEAQEFVSELTLDIFYGNNLLSTKVQYHREIMAKMEKFSKIKGITFHGKVPRKELIRNWLSSGMWCYPTMFLEVFCMCAVEAQATGAIPIINPLWGVGENTSFGKVVQGSPYDDELVQARFVEDIIQTALHPAWQEELRLKMIPATREKYKWETVIKEWENVLCHL